MTAPEAAFLALKSAVQGAVDEAIPSIVERLAPALLAELKAIGVDGHRPGGGAVYITVKAAAEIMTAHPSTVRKLLCEGKLGRFSVEGRLRIKVSDIHAYMAREAGVSPAIDINDRALAILGQSRAKNDT